MSYGEEAYKEAREGIVHFLRPIIEEIIETQGGAPDLIDFYDEAFFYRRHHRYFPPEEARELLEELPLRRPGPEIPREPEEEEEAEIEWWITSGDISSRADLAFLAAVEIRFSDYVDRINDAVEAAVRSGEVPGWDPDRMNPTARAIYRKAQVAEWDRIVWNAVAAVAARVVSADPPEYAGFPRRKYRGTKEWLPEE